MATGSSAGFVDVTMASMDASIRGDGHIGIESVRRRPAMLYTLYLTKFGIPVALEAFIASKKECRS